MHGEDTVPPLESVTERLLREEQKMREKGVDDSKSVLMAKGNFSSKKKQFTCHYCKKPGHFKKDCRDYRTRKVEGSVKPKHQSHQPGRRESHDAMLITHALIVRSNRDWIVDSGATCHMCNDKTMFTEMKDLNPRENVTLGDGHNLEAVGEGTVDMEMLLPNGGSRMCALKNVLYIPKLAYNLVSVSKAAQMGKTIEFYNSSCEFVNSSNETIAFATKQGSLYYLEFLRRKSQESVNTAQTGNKERLWHRRFGHLSEQGMQKLARKELVNHMDYNTSREVGFCEACVGGKQHKNSLAQRHLCLWS